MHALIAKKKIGFIDGTIEEPSQDANSIEFELWNQCNRMVISWLTHLVEADIAEGIIHARQLIKCGLIFTINSHKRMLQQFFRYKSL